MNMRQKRRARQMTHKNTVRYLNKHFGNKWIRHCNEYFLRR